MKVIGEIIVQVKYGKYKGDLKLYVVEEAGPNLMGIKLVATDPSRLEGSGSCNCKRQTTVLIRNIEGT